MAMEQVLSDRDSEDEVDDDVADLEDQRVCLCIIIIILMCIECVRLASKHIHVSFVH